MRHSLSVLTVLAVWAASANLYGQVVDTISPNNYHYQVYNNWCGSASIEMMLDCPAVTGSNTWLSTSSFADAPAVPAGGARPTPTFQNIGGVNYVSSNMQAFIYGLNHGANTFNGQTYSNPNVPYGVGTDSAGVVFDLQNIDNPTVNGGWRWSGVRKPRLRRLQLQRLSHFSRGGRGDANHRQLFGGL